MATPPSIERVSIWILEVLEEERQREPNCMKCRLESDVLGTLKARHSTDDSTITKGLRFCLDRGYVSRLKRQDGIATSLTDDGIKMLGQIQQCRLDEEEKKKWSRSDKIALASFIFSVLTFVAGYFAGAQASKKSDSMQTPPPQTATNITSSPKLP
jgi:hypothetical protein